jgi:hypothetical protein
MTSAVQSHIGSDQRERIQLTIRGTVQGIGFRPFVFRLAQDLSVKSRKVVCSFLKELRLGFLPILQGLHRRHMA